MAKTLKPITTKAKTLSYDKEIEFAGLSLIGKVLYIATYFAMPFASWMWKKNLPDCFANTTKRRQLCLLSEFMKLG